MKNTKMTPPPGTRFLVTYGRNFRVQVNFPGLELSIGGEDFFLPQIQKWSLGDLIKVKDHPMAKGYNDFLDNIGLHSMRRRFS